MVDLGVQNEGSSWEVVQEYFRIFPMENIDVEDMADQSMPTKLVRKCGKDSMIPAVMAVDSLAQKKFLNHCKIFLSM